MTDLVRDEGLAAVGRPLLGDGVRELDHRAVGFVPPPGRQAAHAAVGTGAVDDRVPVEFHQHAGGEGAGERFDLEPHALQRSGLLRQLGLLGGDHLARGILECDEGGHGGVVEGRSACGGRRRVTQRDDGVVPGRDVRLLEGRRSTGGGAEERDAGIRQLRLGARELGGLLRQLGVEVIEAFDVLAEALRRPEQLPEEDGLGVGLGQRGTDDLLGGCPGIARLVDGCRQLVLRRAVGEHTGIAVEQAHGGVGGRDKLADGTRHLRHGGLRRIERAVELVARVVVSEARRDLQRTHGGDGDKGTRDPEDESGSPSSRFDRRGRTGEARRERVPAGRGDGDAGGVGHAVGTSGGNLRISTLPDASPYREKSKAPASAGAFGVRG
ncbi:hypothetical protein [Microbacterium phyllosphaerae]|uniref:hypothetical protein n=1 Tax=Microbacterium phyllosphaerae TaxID=124798 RepID=UPI002168B716|nr:hypothetical protein [Microbacterium phyllosphaerae]MCS3444486.1 hypothetical protein [Microbacterium phyllosphaerae]